MIIFYPKIGSDENSKVVSYSTDEDRAYLEEGNKTIVDSLKAWLIVHSTAY